LSSTQLITPNMHAYKKQTGFFMDIKPAYEELKQRVCELEKEIIEHKQIKHANYKNRDELKKTNDLLTVIIFSKTLTAV